MLRLTWIDFNQAAPGQWVVPVAAPSSGRASRPEDDTATPTVLIRLSNTCASKSSLWIFPCRVL